MYVACNYYFFNMSTQEKREEIRISDFRFIRGGLKPIELLLRDT
jgi:hypothetical protein